MKNALQKGPDCLSIEQLEQFVERPQEAAGQHVRSCSYCQNELLLLREFQSGSVRDDETEAVQWISNRIGLAHPKATVMEMPARRRPFGRGMTVLLAIAAALLVAVTIQRRPSAATNSEPDVARSVPLKAVSPVGELQGVPDEFRWTAVPGATRYRLRVTEVDRTVVLDTTVFATSLPTPADLRALLAPGKTLEWSVAAEDPQGREIAASGTHQFSTKHLQN